MVAKAAKKKAKPTIKQKVVKLSSAKAMARSFNCPRDCKSLTVSTRVTPAKLSITF